ncbi:hypothetical protein KFE25_006000 [Diacronema lutheri]|uniref:Vesicle tethering protein Uso1/P115-like head domain-containing protein n=1 Tax=Diacronema lutheri TaxID=2081491 RepID=A0A8J5XX36_DIALT|nr:hypothetical protein KFE25_006000 [Diacronema lutheri]
MMAGGAEPSLEQRASRLFDRLETAPQPEDRRQALDALSAMVSEHAVRLSGAEAVGVLLRALADADDVEMKRDVLDVLVDLLDPKVPSSDLAAAAAKAAHNLDAVLEDPSAIVAILGCLELEDQRLRYNAIQLMLVVLAAERGRVQGFLLSNPMGAAAATDLLSDRREVVRNHALLLLAELTKGSTEIGRFVAFQGAFDRLLEIVEEEAEEGGSIILHDALALIATLLVRNPATQRLFAETGGVQKLLPFLSSDTTDAATAKFAPKQLTGSQVRVCEVLSALVDEPLAASDGAPLALDGSARACRALLGSAGIVAALAQLATSATTATEPALRSAAMRALCGAIRAHEPNQQLLLGLHVAIPPARTESAPLRLLNLGLRASTRAAAEPPLRVLRALLDGSAHAQLHLAASLAPVPTGLSAGAPTAAGGAAGAAGGGVGGVLAPSFCRTLALVLVGGAAPSATQAQLAAAVIASLVRGNKDVKELLMRMPVEPSLDDTATAQPHGAARVDGAEGALPTAASAGMLGRICARVLAVARPAAESADDAELDMPRAAHALALLRSMADFADGSARAVALILGWPALLPALVDIAAGGVASEQPALAGADADTAAAAPARASRPPLPLAANADAAMHIRGAAATVLGRCLLHTDDEKGPISARALLELLHRRLGLDSLLESLERVRTSPQLVAASRASGAPGGASARAPFPSAADAEQIDAVILPCVGPLPLFSAADAAALSATRDGVQDAILQLYAAAASPLPGAPAQPAKPHEHSVEPPAAAPALEAERAEGGVPGNGAAADADAAQRGDAARMDGPATVGVEGLPRVHAAESGLPGTDGACDQLALSYKQLIREQDEQLSAAREAVARAAAAQDDATTAAALHFADARRSLIGVRALRDALDDSDAELTAALAARGARAPDGAMGAASREAAAVSSASASAQASVAVAEAAVATDSEQLLPTDSECLRADEADSEAASAVARAEAVAASAVARAALLDAALAEARETAARLRADAASADAQLAAERARLEAARGAGSAAAEHAAGAAASRTHGEDARAQMLAAQLAADVEAADQRCVAANASASEHARRAEQAEIELEAARAAKAAALDDAASARARAGSLAAQLDEARALADAASREAERARSEAAAIGARLAEAAAAQAATERALSAKAEALEALAAEHEECLCCLAEQDMHCTALQEQLALHGLSAPFPATPGETPTLSVS